MTFSCLLQIVKEYERAIIFRLGRILKGGAKGPGMSWRVALIFVLIELLAKKSLPTGVRLKFLKNFVTSIDKICYLQGEGSKLIICEPSLDLLS